MFKALSCALLFSLAVSGHPAAEEPFKPFKLKTVDGQQKTLQDVLGPKATLVVFFFPTCRYCTAALPHAQRLYDAYRDRGLSMVWINAVPKEDRLVADWRAKHGYSVPALIGASQRAIDGYKLTMTPTHYLLDAEGRVVASHAGYRAGDEQELERQIQGLLQE